MTKRERIAAKFGGRCAYCGEPLTTGWCADHVEPVGRVPAEHRAKHGKLEHPERDTEDNLFPACRVCNYAKNTMTIEGLRAQISEQVSRARRGSWNFRMAEKFGLVQVVEKPVVFWFEQFKGVTP